ncbi:FG-GAP repeat protein [Streptomyces sp. NPDC003877]
MRDLLTATTTAAAAAKHVDDFNGDGYRDLVIGSGGATVGGAQQAGAVTVVWGSAAGLDTGRRTVVSQNSPGVPGAAETNDFFGTDITTRDLNRDGFADMIATAPGEDDGEYHGVFTVLWGSASGLTSGSVYRNPKYKDEGFAKDIAVGDFNADGKQDVVSVDDNHIWYLRGPFTKSGSRGTATNLDPIDGENISPDLAVGVKGESLGDSLFYAGGVTVLRGGSSGITGTGARWYDYATTGVEGEPTEEGWLGASVQLRDFTRDSRAELVAAAPEAGRLYLMPGSASGPTGSGSTRLTARTLGVSALRGTLTDQG